MGFIKSRLGLMMFMQYAVWGIWMPILPGYLQAPIADGGLGFSAAQLGWILGLAGAIGALLSPFIAGQIADRYFSAERFLAFLLFTGGIVKYITATQTSFTAWLVLSILYSILYMPTLSLTNSVAFAHLKDKETEFPRVRVWGTFGWIAAGWIFSWVFLQTDLKFTNLPPFLVGTEYPDVTARLAMALKVSGVISMLYAGYCLLLPHTPPKGNVESVAVFKAFKLLEKPSVLWLVLASIPIAVIHNLYFMQAFPFLSIGVGMNESNIAPAMSIGQVAEIGVMAMLGFIIAQLGFRFTLCLGGLAYILRFAIWGAIGMSDDVGSTGVTIAVLSQALHGFSFACFFATAFIYIDRVASDDIRHSAQTVFGIAILGIGPILSGPILGVLANIFGDGNVVTNFSDMWFTLSGVAVLTTLALMVFFRDEGSDNSDGDIEAEAAVDTP